MAVLVLRGAKKIGSLGDLDLRVTQRQDTVHVVPFESIERSSRDLDGAVRPVREARMSAVKRSQDHTAEYVGNVMLSTCPTCRRSRFSIFPTSSNTWTQN